MAIIDEYDFDADFEQSQWKLILDRRPQMVASTMGGRSVFWSPQIIVLLSNHPIGRGHPFTDVVFRTRFSETFNDWNWIYTENGQRYPRLACPLYHPPVELHGTIDLYPAYVPPSERFKKRAKQSAAKSAGYNAQSENLWGGSSSASESPRNHSFEEWSQPHAATSAAASPYGNTRPPAPSRASSSSSAESAAHRKKRVTVDIDDDDDTTALWVL